LYLTYVAIWFGLALIPHAMMPASGIFNIVFLKIIITAAFLVLWIIGLTGANNAEEKPIPLLGGVAQSVFAFI